MEDFANHTSEWVEPISTTYRGLTVWELPPNPQGLAALQMLNILEGFDVAALGRDSTDFWHLMIEAKKIAYEDRARYYADMPFSMFRSRDCSTRVMPPSGQSSSTWSGPPKPSSPAIRRSTTATPPSWSRPTPTACWCR